VLLTIIPSLLIGYYIISKTRDEIKSGINEELISVSQSLSNEINYTFLGINNSFSFLKYGFTDNSPTPETKINFLMSSAKNIKELISMKLMLQRSTSFEEVIQIDKESVNEGNNEKFINSILYKDYKEEIKQMLAGNITISQPVYKEQLGKWIANYLVVFSESEKERFFVFAKIDLSKLASIIINNPFSNIGKISVLTDKGNLLFQAKDTNFISPQLREDISNILTKSAGVTCINSYKNKNGEESIYCYSTPSSINWGIIVSVSAATAYSSLEKLVTTIIFRTILALILAILAALFFAKNLSTPITGLAGKANDIATGNFDVSISYPVNDSIGKLDTSLIKMSQSLKENFEKIENQKQELENYNRTLEQKVEERTAELKIANQDLASANMMLTDLNKEKNEFLGIAAHDLKNPLTAIKGYGETMLIYPDMTEEVKENFIKTIVESANKMFSIVTTLLDVNAIEQGKLKINLSPTELNQLTSELYYTYQPQALKKKINLILSVPEERLMANTDAGILKQVLDNLVSNAIKFSPFDKNIQITLTNKNGIAKVGVRDEGPGFSENDKQKIFGKFAKLSAKPTNNEHSTGLGLSIVKKLTELLGCNIELISEKDKGAEFVVTIPLMETIIGSAE